MDEARRKANATQQDLILINPDVQPAVCRLMDYSEELGRKFMKEILVTDQDKRKSFALYVQVRRCCGGKPNF